LLTALIIRQLLPTPELPMIIILKVEAISKLISNLLRSISYASIWWTIWSSLVSYFENTILGAADFLLRSYSSSVGLSSLTSNFNFSPSLIGLGLNSAPYDGMSIVSLTALLLLTKFSCRSSTLSLLIKPKVEVTHSVHDTNRSRKGYMKYSGTVYSSRFGEFSMELISVIIV
jgi:hypothetical protein